MEPPLKASRRSSCACHAGEPRTESDGPHRSHVVVEAVFRAVLFTV